MRLTRLSSWSMMDVSKMKPNGIQLRKRRRVSRVFRIRDALWAFCRTSKHNWKMSLNSPHNEFFRFLIFSWVMDSAEKSKISSDNILKITMLFSHKDREVLDDATISVMNVGQLCGHSCFKICGGNDQPVVEPESNLMYATNLNQQKIELVQIDLLPPHTLLIRSYAQSCGDNEVSDACIVYQMWQVRAARNQETHLAADPLGRPSILFGRASPGYSTLSTVSITVHKHNFI